MVSFNFFGLKITLGSHLNPRVAQYSHRSGSTSHRRTHSTPQAYRPQPQPQHLHQGHQPRLRPLTAQPSSTSNTPDLDLDLGSLWFAKSPIAFPPRTINKKKINYTSSSGWSSVGPRKTYTFTAHIRHNDTLASTKIHLTWDGSNPGYTVRAQQKHYPPPRRLSKAELEKYRERFVTLILLGFRNANNTRYSNAIAAWCESKMGRQVGNGECWTLAHDALEAVSAMPSQSLIHGSLLYTYIPPASPEPPGGILEAGVARGDVIQLLKAHFKSKDGSQKWAGDPDHTAVVTGVELNGVLRVVEQNSGGVKVVKKGSYDMSELVKGEVRIFRAVSESWVGKLDAKW
jgi:hypothetical protein